MKTDSEQPKPTEQKPREVAANIPKIEVRENIPQVGGALPDSEFTKGVFVKKSDGEPYALAVHEPDAYGKTHTLKNSAYFWQGTEDEFDSEFSKTK